MRAWWGVATALAVAACGRAAGPSVEGAWVRLPAVPGRPAAAYFMLYGGGTDAALIQVTASGSARGELHESMANGMRPSGSVRVPAGGTASFAPGGRHVMLFDLDPQVKPGDRMTLRLLFADSRVLTTEAKVVAAADPAP